MERRPHAWAGNVQRKGWHSLPGQLDGRPEKRARYARNTPSPKWPHRAPLAWTPPHSAWVAGHKRFPNGDQYQGLWRNGQPNGPGMYKVRRSNGCATSLSPRPYATSVAQWANGNEFNGEWVAGLMCGRGTFVWSTGERYDGEWRDGKEEGRGTFTWPDGSYFDGNWVGGEKHGVGIWAPPVAASDASAPGAPRDAVLREYDRGSLVREELVPAQQRPVGDPVAGRPAVKTRKVREVRMGETIFKGAPSYDLMLQLQLGVRWSVGRITPERPRDLSDQDYASNSPLARVSARFPRRGSSTTPPHASHDFKWFVLLVPHDTALP